MNNEVTIEELDKSYKEALKIKEDSEHKLEELSRKLGVMEVRLKWCVKQFIKYFYIPRKN